VTRTANRHMVRVRPYGTCWSGVTMLGHLVHNPDLNERSSVYRPILPGWVRRAFAALFRRH